MRFVFGGDLFDRGEGDLRLARELVDLKRRHPDRVVLLMGNRDINKMRLTAELSDEALALGPERAFRAWWDAKAPSLEQHLQGRGLADTRVNRLKWMLEHTMGSPGAFEFRRRELSVLQGVSGDSVSDQDVTRSYEASVRQGGAVADYLEHAQIAALVGDTLFVHGAVAERAAGFVPSPKTRYQRHSQEAMRALPGAQSGLPLRKWVSGLNAFAAQAVEDWLAAPSWRADGTRGGEALMAYQSRPATAGMTVVVTCYVDGKNMPSGPGVFSGSKEGTPKCSNPASPEVMRYLELGGAHRVVVGHKPSGDAPASLSLRTPGTYGFEVVSADTNYATGATPCGRGGSWCEVRISMPSESRLFSQARFRGSLCDGGGDYDFSLEPLGGGAAPNSGDRLVGRQTPDGWWVRLRLGRPMGGLEYMLSRGTGREAEYRRVAASEVEVMDYYHYCCYYYYYYYYYCYYYYYSFYYSYFYYYSLYYYSLYYYY